MLCWSQSQTDSTYKILTCQECIRWHDRIDWNLKTGNGCSQHLSLYLDVIWSHQYCLLNSTGELHSTTAIIILVFFWVLRNQKISLILSLHLMNFSRYCSVVHSRVIFKAAVIELVLLHFLHDVFFFTAMFQMVLKTPQHKSPFNVFSF